MSDELKIAIEAAKAGADKALEYFDKDLVVEYKEDETPVTVADGASEEVVKQTILKHFPKTKFVGEETGGDFAEEEFWVIDPIDGTRSFMRGIPNWCVIVSLCRKKKIELACIYYPENDTVFYAQKGKGAYMNNKRLYVSKVADIKRAFFGFGSIKHFGDKQILLDLADACGAGRGWDPTFSGCMVAAGKVDFTVDAFGKIWDVAPFKVLVEEAGGRITRMDGSEWKPDDKQGCVLSNGLLHDEVVRIVGGRK